jgi:biopolymer transport protein ExbB
MFLMTSTLTLASAPGFASILGFFTQSGPFMVLLILLSIMALTIIIWRGIALRHGVILPEKLEQAMDDLKPHADPVPLLQLTAKDTSPLAGIVRVLLEHRHWPMSEAREAATARARHELARMEKGLVFLEITTGVAPLLGLLGTLSGLVGVFANLGDTGDPTLVARGIAEALNTTIMGLSVAAPSLIAYNYFVRKVEIMAIEMEALVGELMEKVYIDDRHRGNR